MADPKRMEAAFLWVSAFYGPEVDLPPAEKPEDFWTEHILSLANLCKSKVARRVTAESAIKAYEEAKRILRMLDQQASKMDRWIELDPVAAARGDRTAIYKFIVLFLHNLCNFVDDYITESQEFLVAKGIEKPFVDLLSDVNSAASKWWQGTNSADSSSAISSPIEKENSFGKYSIMEVPSTPRTPFQRRAPVTPLSPIQRAVHSPVTVKIRQDEYKKMRTRMLEMEDALELSREDYMSIKKENQQYKESALEWREKYEAAAGLTKQLQSERQELIENVDKAKINTEKLISQLRDYKRRVEQEVAESEQLRRDRDKAAEDLDRVALAKSDLEKKLQDLMDEHKILKENKTTADNLLDTANRQNQQYVEIIREKASEVERLREECRLMLSKKDEESAEILVRESDLRLDLQNSRRQIEELTGQLQEVENTKAEVENRLRDKEMELNEKKHSSNEEMKSLRENSSRQQEQLVEKNRKLQFLVDQANNMNLEQEKTIQDLREKMLNGHMELDVLRVQNLELEAKLEEKSQEIQTSWRRMEELEKRVESFRPLLASTSAIEIKEEVQEPQSGVNIEEMDDNAEEDTSKNKKDADLKLGIGYMEWATQDRNESLMYSRSILGTESTNIVAVNDEKDHSFNQDVDKARIEELQRRNKAVPACLRSSYALEMANYESPSAEEQRIKGQNLAFRVPHSPPNSRIQRTSRDASPSRFSLISRADSIQSRAESVQSRESSKENSILVTKPPPSGKKANRRVSLGNLFNGFKKH